MVVAGRFPLYVRVVVRVYTRVRASVCIGIPV